MEQQGILRKIPKVDELLSHPALSALDLPAGSVRDAVRRELEALRSQVLSGALEALPDHDAIAAAAGERARREALPSLRPVINGTGVVLHTNLGRSLLSWQAVNAVEQVARSYSTLEYDVESGSRGSRHSHVDSLLAEVTGAEAAMVVNNNAAAVLLILSAMGKGGEVIPSRGELVEIGGSFRIPDIMTQCGCTLREVGTTNKTHLFDYENAIGEETRALLRVHTSNYRIVGFSERPPLEELGDIKTAVSEAVTNAIVHAYPDCLGKITLRLRLFEGGVLELQVRDSGVGIPDVDQARTPLFTTGGEERSGMGFTIMESFMDTLKVRSAPGRGTTVTMARKISRRAGR